MYSLSHDLKSLSWCPDYKAQYPSDILYSVSWLKDWVKADIVSFLMKLYYPNLNLECANKAWYISHKRSIFLYHNATDKYLGLFSLSKLFIIKRCLKFKIFT